MARTIFARTAGRPSWAAAVLVALSAGSASSASCSDQVAAFNTAVGSAADMEAQTLVDAVAGDSSCAAYLVPMQRRLAAMRLKTVQDGMAQNKPVATFEDALQKADRPQVLWQASATLGQVRFSQRRFAEAAQAYDRAIEVVGNETVTPTPPPRPEIEGLITRAGQARLLAATTAEGNRKPAFVATASNTRDGRLGGVFTPAVRGIVPRAVPVPITFEFRSADLTAIGEDAARELVRAIKEQQPDRVIMVGHTDPRGTEVINKKLSKERADKVAAFLKDNGVTIPVETEGVGASEPVQVQTDSGLTQDDVFTLNRRVEWRRP